MATETEAYQLRFVPHPKQQEVIKALPLARYITVVTGNQAGKTLLGRNILIPIVSLYGNAENCSLILSTDYKSIDRNITSHLKVEAGDLITKIDEVNHKIVWWNGHITYLFSTENLKSIEGATNCIFAWIDEGSDIPDEGYDRIRVRLMTLRGRRLITATAVLGVGVKRLEEEYKKGLDPKTCDPSVPYHKRHMSFSWTSWDNPYLSSEELDELEQDIMTPAERAIRLHGKFENLGGRVFNDKNLLTPQWMGYNYNDISELNLVHYGLIDTASGQTQNEKNDNTALVIVGIAPRYGIYGRECIAGKLSVNEISAIIRAKSRQYGIEKWGIEAIAAQINYALEAFRQAQNIDDYYRFVPLPRVGGNNMKPARHARLLPYLESRRLKFPVDERGAFSNGFEELIKEMEDTPYGRHDDRIDALADIANKDFIVLEGDLREPERTRQERNQTTLLTREELTSLRTEKDYEPALGLVA